MIYVVPSLLLRQSSMIYLPLHAVGNRRQFILVHVCFSEIRATIPGRGKRPAPVSTDQPHKHFRKESTNHDYCKGKL